MVSETSEVSAISALSAVSALSELADPGFGTEIVSPPGAGIFGTPSAGGPDDRAAFRSAAVVAPVPEPAEWQAMGVLAASVVGLILRSRRTRRRRGGANSEDSRGV
jgi:hypothetical protein